MLEKIFHWAKFWNFFFIENFFENWELRIERTGSWWTRWTRTWTTATSTWACRTRFKGVRILTAARQVDCSPWVWNQWPTWSSIWADKSNSHLAWWSITAQIITAIVQHELNAFLSTRIGSPQTVVSSVLLWSVSKKLTPSSERKKKVLVSFVFVFFQ